MPRIQINRRAINYEIDGPADGAVLTFGHAQILDLRSWAPQVAAFSDRYRVLRIDFRGHGGSDLGPGQHSIEDLAADVVALLDELKIKKAHYIGSSLGGMVGFALALEYADRLSSVTFLATQGDLPSSSAERLRKMIAAARAESATMVPKINEILERYMAPGYAEAHPQAFADLRQIAAETSVEGFAHSSEAIIAMNFDQRLAEITTPSFVVAGELDAPTPPERMELYRDGIAGARMTVIEGAGHFPNYDQADRFNTVLAEFLGTVG